MRTIVSIAALIAALGSAAGAEAPIDTPNDIATGRLIPSAYGVEFSGAYELGAASISGLRRDQYLFDSRLTENQDVVFSDDLEVVFGAHTGTPDFALGFRSTIIGGDAESEQQVYLSSRHGDLRFGTIDEARNFVLRDPDLIQPVTNSDVLDSYSSWSPLKSNRQRNGAHKVFRWDSNHGLLDYSLSARLQHGECEMSYVPDEQAQEIKEICDSEGPAFSLAARYPVYLDRKDIVVSVSYSYQDPNARELTVQGEVYWNSGVYAIARHSEFRDQVTGYSSVQTWYGDNWDYEYEVSESGVSRDRSEVSVGYDDGKHAVAIHAVEMDSARMYGVAGSRTFARGLEATASVGKIDHGGEWGINLPDSEMIYGAGLRVKF